MQQNTLITKPLLKSLGVDSEASNRNFAFLQLFTIKVSEAQIVALTKAAKFGWKATKIVYKPMEEVCAIALCSGDTAAWMMPDGTIQRAPNGKKTAYLPKDWVEHN